MLLAAAALGAAMHGASSTPKLRLSFGVPAIAVVALVILTVARSRTFNFELRAGWFAAATLGMLAMGVATAAAVGAATRDEAGRALGALASTTVLALLSGLIALTPTYQEGAPWQPIAADWLVFCSVFAVALPAVVLAFERQRGAIVSGLRHAMLPIPTTVVLAFAAWTIATRMETAHRTFIDAQVAAASPAGVAATPELGVIGDSRWDGPVVAVASPSEDHSSRVGAAREALRTTKPRPASPKRGLSLAFPAEITAKALGRFLADVVGSEPTRVHLLARGGSKGARKGAKSISFDVPAPPGDAITVRVTRDEVVVRSDRENPDTCRFQRSPAGYLVLDGPISSSLQIEAREKPVVMVADDDVPLERLAIAAATLRWHAYQHLSETIGSTASGTPTVFLSLDH